MIKNCEYGKKRGLLGGGLLKWLDYTKSKCSNLVEEGKKYCDDHICQHCLEGPVVNGINSCSKCFVQELSRSKNSYENTQNQFDEIENQRDLQEKDYVDSEPQSFSSGSWEKWKGIHRDFTEELVLEWINRGFNYETAKYWFEVVGNEPTAYNFASWIRNTNKFTHAGRLNGWLTDDNLQYILKNKTKFGNKEVTNLTDNYLIVEQIKVRTDLAGIYHCFQSAKTDQDWPLEEFFPKLEHDKKAITIFPLRVSGNHWGLFILEEFGDSYRVYYTSSLVPSREVKEIKPLIKQICGDDVAEKIQIIQPTDKQKNSYDCGVYLIFYIWEILEKQKLELTRTHSPDEIANFRKEWQAKVGWKWCAEDDYLINLRKGYRQEKKRSIQNTREYQSLVEISKLTSQKLKVLDKKNDSNKETNEEKTIQKEFAYEKEGNGENSQKELVKFDSEENEENKYIEWLVKQAELRTPTKRSRVKTLMIGENQRCFQTKVNGRAKTFHVRKTRSKKHQWKEEKLEGNLSLKGYFSNLNILILKNNNISSFDFGEIEYLTFLDLKNNQLKKSDFINYLPISLEKLDIRNNNLPETDLSCFSHLVNLRELKIGNGSFAGSIKSLANLAKLEKLELDCANIDLEGLEDKNFLPLLDKNQLFCQEYTKKSKPFTLVIDEEALHLEVSNVNCRKRKMSLNSSTTPQRSKLFVYDSDCAEVEKTNMTTQVQQQLFPFRPGKK